MTIISPTPPPRAPSGPGASPARSSGFTVPEGSEPAGGLTAAEAVAHPGDLPGLLALQAEPEPPDAAARRRGRSLLGGLASLQRALLGAGEVAPTLGRLRHELEALPVAEDAGLAAAMAAIVLRVHVELARFDPA